MTEVSSMAPDGPLTLLRVCSFLAAGGTFVHLSFWRWPSAQPMAEKMAPRLAGLGDQSARSLCRVGLLHLVRGPLSPGDRWPSFPALGAWPAAWPGAAPPPLRPAGGGSQPRDQRGAWRSGLTCWTEPSVAASACSGRSRRSRPHADWSEGLPVNQWRPACVIALSRGAGGAGASGSGRGRLSWWLSAHPWS